MGRTSGRPAGRTTGGQQRTSSRRYQTRTYIDGNTVRTVETEVRPRQQQPRRVQKAVRPGTSKRTRRNREKALKMDLGYVAFLAVAASVSLFVCVNFLQLQAESTSHRKSVASLTSEYSELKLANDTEYERALASVDLEYIKDVAMNKLGMVYATQGQIITYDSQASDYVRQYEDVPTK